MILLIKRRDSWELTELLKTYQIPFEELETNSHITSTIRITDADFFGDKLNNIIARTGAEIFKGNL